MSLCFECVLRANWINAKQQRDQTQRKHYSSKILDLMLNLEFVTNFFIPSFLVHFVMCTFAFRKRHKSTKELPKKRK